MCSASSVGSMNCSGIGLVGSFGRSSGSSGCGGVVGIVSSNGSGVWSSSGGWSNLYSSRAERCSMLVDSRSSGADSCGVWCGGSSCSQSLCLFSQMVVTILDLGS